jgi:hypothetical protein
MALPFLFVSFGNRQPLDNLATVAVGVSAPRRCMEDEGRPLGADLQGLASNHLKLLWSNARLVLRYEAANGFESGGMTLGKAE